MEQTKTPNIRSLRLTGENKNDTQSGRLAGQSAHTLLPDATNKSRIRLFISVVGVVVVDVVVVVIVECLQIRSLETMLLLLLIDAGLAFLECDCVKAKSGSFEVWL